MKWTFALCFLLILIALVNKESTSMMIDRSKLTAVNGSFYSKRLYEELRNEEMPFETDAALTDFQLRRLICEEIVTNGFFDVLKFTIFNTYDRGQYKNPYRQQVFSMSGSYRFQEYVFGCPVEDSANEAVIAFFITKEYNVSPFHNLYKPGRFVFKDFTPGYVHPYNYMLLAEEPAQTFTEPGFNIELLYLQIREYVEPVEDNSVDPLCKLISSKENDLTNQHNRFCTAVARSSHFKNSIKYPWPTPYSCHRKKISFRTAEGRSKAAEKSYYERISLCHARLLESHSSGEEQQENNIRLYFSRAYLSNLMFVYRRDPENSKIYLENVSTNIAIADELNSFDFIED